MKEPFWIAPKVAIAVHEEQIAEHGGQGGIRDAGLLDSALARPRNKAVFAKPDLADLAAAYAFGVVKNHPFVDGNKRVAAVLMELFLELNGVALPIGDPALVQAIIALADGRLTEAGLARRLRALMRRA